MARRTFFSFHYKPDVWRAWNVRNSQVVTSDNEVEEGFFDSSVFEASKKEGDQQLKDFLRDGMKNSSVTCVLAGAQTWKRRWVRYEIARSIVKGNGLLTVYIHGVKDRNGETSAQGADPLAQIGLYKANNAIYLAEHNGDQWIKYEDYTLAIPTDKLWFPAPTSADVVILSTKTKSYNFSTQSGRDNLSGWIEAAAKAAGR